MRIPLTAQQVEDCLDQIITLIPRVRQAHGILRILELEEKADGYPQNTGWDKGSPTTELDDDGTPLPPRTDPTANAVMRRNGHGFVREVLHETVVAIHTARRNLEHAECEAMRAMPKDEKDRLVVAEGRIIWCRHHEKFGEQEPIGKGGRRGLCGWCEAFEREYKQLPPPSLVKKHARRQRIYDRDIREALKGVA